MINFALTSHDIDEVIFHVASALQVPVLSWRCWHWPR